ncbi:4Fe-4S binding domain-containing protein [Desulfonauticus submarinus]|uniref:4Fe-4S binding domain-containing protein n=1 Tax=Desulfonauticus submarinus TaxID=206665 RepID=A0A1H0F8S8_9BACT|nr:4Fe-4S binding protein [Desulfonauticus submarinus]SDN91054.1 4Fe-4S binding domain-containing protein [Desulfonauticus submarinus]
MKIYRKIIQINEELCNGCGKCIPACEEGALAIIDGKAKVVSEKFCDGLGDCIGTCPTGALTIIEREAEEFDENAAMEHVKSFKQANCSSFNTPTSLKTSLLSHWPVKIKLIPVETKFLQNSHLLVAGDCVPVAFSQFQTKINQKVVLIGCPKFDNQNEYLHKFTEIFQNNSILSITVLEMEVPCCFGLHRIVLQALSQADKKIPFTRIVVFRNGMVKEEKTMKAIF